MHNNSYYIQKAEEKMKEELSGFSTTITSYLQWAIVSKFLCAKYTPGEDEGIFQTLRIVNSLNPSDTVKELDTVIDTVADCIIDLYNRVIILLQEAYNDYHVNIGTLIEDDAIKEKALIVSQIKKDLPSLYNKLNLLKPTHSKIRRQTYEAMDLLKRNTSTLKLATDIGKIIYNTVVSLHNPAKGIYSHVKHAATMLLNTAYVEKEVKDCFRQLNQYTLEYASLLEYYENSIIHKQTDTLNNYLTNNIMTLLLNNMKLLDQNGCNCSNALDAIYMLYEITNDVISDREEMSVYTEQMMMFSDL